MQIPVIGAGIGGLAIACRLTRDGHEVTVFEKNKNAGGKMHEVREAGFRFDTGPSLLTMPEVLQELFEYCDRSMDDYLQLTTLEPICRYHYPDGTTFNSYDRTERTLTEIQRFAPEDVEAYQQFLSYAEKLYKRTAPAFLFNPLYSWKDFRDVNLLDVFRIDAFSTVSERVDEYFKSSYLRKFFKRFTTYNGSSPFQAPATLNVIPHVEVARGGYYVQGGMYRIAEALQKLANELGVKFEFGRKVEEIITKEGAVNKIRLDDDQTVSLDRLVANSDATVTYMNLLDKTAREVHKPTVEPSCSGYVLLLGCDRQFAELTHHNIFFSSDYQKEFHDIFQKLRMPDDPTIYVANTSHTDPGHAPAGGSNLFVLVNAPHLSEHYDWDKHSDDYAEFLIDELEKRGLKKLRDSIRYRQVINPQKFYQRYLSYRGSIYGTSSNSRFAAFLRPRNKSPEADGLYFAGGSTHPGGGIPLVLLSARHAHTLINRDLKG